MDMVNIEHERAKYAFSKVKGLAECNDDKVKQKYRSAVRSAGVMVRSAGLLQTLSFYLSKEDYTHLAGDILGWEYARPTCASQDIMGIYGALLDSSDYDLMAYTQETVSLIAWLKRFTEAMIEDQDGVNQNEQIAETTT